VARVEVRYLGPAPGASVAVAQAESGPASLLPPGAQPPDPSSPVAAPPVRSAPPRATARQAWAAPPPAAYVAPASYGGYMVQVGAFAALDNAHRARAAILSQGPVAVSAVRVGGAELYRVRLGPWPDRSRAEAARRRVAALGFHDAIIAPR
jgi:rare lipoprotein A